MKWLIINTEAFSKAGIKVGKNASGEKTGKKEVDLSDLPKVLLLFLKKYRSPYIVLDESSKVKVNTPMPEHKKSSRCRLIKLLSRFGERSIATGTLKSKSPCNVYDQYGFLDPSIFPESMYEFAERYCIMVTIRVGRGRRVIISEKIYFKIRTRLSNAWKRGGEEALEFSKASVAREYAMSYPNIEWIISHKEFSPFVNQGELLQRIQAHTMFVKREDVFDITHEHFVHHPIIRCVDPTPEQKKLNNQLVTLGFTDEMSLGKAAALELVHRLQDVCNGFRPIEHIAEDGERSFTYENLKDSPKLNATFDLIDEIDPDENQIAIFCTRTNLIEAINARLESEGINYVWYKDGQKEEAEAAFKSGEARVFLSSLRPSAYGLNSLAQCSYAIYACVDEEAEAYYQSRHRLLRGQLKAPKFAYHICVKGSVDEKRIRSLQRGIDLINYTNTKDTFVM